MQELTYLAVPYSSPDPAIRESRFRAANYAAGMLMNEGQIVFSPISHTHPIAIECDLPKGWDYWGSFDRAYLACSKRVIVLMLDGWRESVGVTAELAIAAEMGIPVAYLDPVTLEEVT